MKSKALIAFCFFLFSFSALQSQTSAAPADVVFRIQLSAFSQPVNKSTVANEFNLKAEDIREEQHNGLYKYTTGNFKSIPEAKKVISETNAMKGKVFIVGYADGLRVEIDEAIRLSNNPK
jgi:hypothetical protein